uniref:NADH-ubiquinone oxidoreductase chain 4 n=1 Tax=Cyanophora biloba TaxID=1489483 RepID=A0A873WUJ6_9EUKA|nr:NADH dehydrogenase subunit 4 [Cyanophora biloba]QPB15004.1 NADH dehydrogenase subunit 4 [Cyanophora biloba]
MDYIFKYTILMPLCGVFVICFLKNTRTIKIVGLINSLITLFLSIILWIYFDNLVIYPQYVIQLDWIPIANFHPKLGIDGLSLFFIVLSTTIIPICLMASLAGIKKQIKEYFICFLILEALLILVFSSFDIFLFYIFFEGVLIPMFLIIGVWGSRERKIRAGYYFFLYTLVGSVLMLLSIIWIYFKVGTTDLTILYQIKFTELEQILLWLAFFSSFAVKVPMIPFHIWLPEAHVESPTAGSLMLAGVLLKLGTYGFLRFSIPLFSMASIYFTPLIYTISLIGIIYGSLTTLRQIDLKKIIAYSSVAHMSFVTLGLFALNMQSLEGSILLMISHGLVSPALFFLVGVLYDRYHTRLLYYYSGLVHTMPLFALFFVFFTMANISLPGTSSFIGEFLSLLGVYSSNNSVAIIATLGIILGAAYALWLCNRIVFGIIKIDYIVYSNDMNKREFVLAVLLSLGTLWIGIYPNLFFSTLHTSVSYLLTNVN